MATTDLVSWLVSSSQFFLAHDAEICLSQTHCSVVTGRSRPRHAFTHSCIHSFIHSLPRSCTWRQRRVRCGPGHPRTREDGPLVTSVTRPPAPPLSLVARLPLTFSHVELPSVARRLPSVPLMLTPCKRAHSPGTGPLPFCSLTCPRCSAPRPEWSRHVTVSPVMEGTDVSRSANPPSGAQLNATPLQCFPLPGPAGLPVGHSRSPRHLRLPALTLVVIDRLFLGCFTATCLPCWVLSSRRGRAGSVLVIADLQPSNRGPLHRGRSQNTPD